MCLKKSSGVKSKTKPTIAKRLACPFLDSKRNKNTNTNSSGHSLKVCVTRGLPSATPVALRLTHFYEITRGVCVCLFDSVGARSDAFGYEVRELLLFLRSKGA